MMRRIEDRSKKRDKFIDDADDNVGDNHEARAQGYSPASKTAASTDDCAE